VLADLIRTNRHNHRPVAGDSDLAQGARALARAHQAMMCAVQRWSHDLMSLHALHPLLQPRCWPKPGPSMQRDLLPLAEMTGAAYRASGRLNNKDHLNGESAIGLG
jgi:hypothetical protein